MPNRPRRPDANREPQWRPPRSGRRMKSHHSSDAAGAAERIQILEHPLVCAEKTPIYIDTQSGMQSLLETLRAAGAFAYDTEFIGEHSYRPHLCLVQVATPELVALIDPLAGLDLTPLWELLADENVLKIVHAGEQDLEPVYRHLGKPAKGIFDTQVAAGFAELPYPMALTKLVNQVLGASMGRDVTFVQWDDRPLSPVQQQYAANDVRYLSALHATLKTTLEENGNLAWARAACGYLESEDNYRSDPQTQRLRCGGIDSLTGKQQAVLAALLKFRDDLAREHDLPPRSVLKDPVLVELARQDLEEQDQLQHVRGLPRPLRQQYGNRVLALAREAAAKPVRVRPALRPADTDRHRQRVKQLFAELQEHCRSIQIDPGVVLSKRDVERLVLRAEHGKTLDGRLTEGWRHEILAPVLDPWMAAQG